MDEQPELTLLRAIAACATGHGTAEQRSCVHDWLDLTAPSPPPPAQEPSDNVLADLENAGPPPDEETTDDASN